MIRITDSLRLSYTKLRARRLRLIVTVVISGLLFTVLIATSLVVRGVIDGFQTFSKEGFGERYIAMALPNVPMHDVLPPDRPEVIKRAKQLQADLIARKKAEAKRLGIPYDEKSEPPAVEPGFSGGNSETVSFASPAGLQALAEYTKKLDRTPGIKHLKEAGIKYGATGYYSLKSSMGGIEPPYLKVLKGGKEKVSDNSQLDMGQGEAKGADAFSSNWMSIDTPMLEPYLLDGQSMDVGKDKSIPLFVPYRAAQDLIGLEALPPTATPAEKLERLKQVRQKVAGYKMEVCYRNTTSSRDLNDAVSQQAELAQNKNNKEFIRPTLIKTPSKKACAAPVVQEDKRLTEEKLINEKEEQFRRKFGEVAPISQIMKIRVVGITPDIPDGGAFGVLDVLQSVVSSAVLPGWFSPTEAIAKHKTANQIFNDKSDSYYATEQAGLNPYYIELPDAQTADRFLREQNCEPTGDPAKSDFGQNCVENDQHFFLSPFGVSLAIKDAEDFLGKYFKYGVLIVAGISAIIMMGTVGRIIADSRRETAVFRAIGAKRLDITAIYLLYVLFLAMFIVIFAYVTGSLLAGYMNQRYATELTVNSIIAFNANDLSRKMTLYGFYIMDMLYVVGLIVAAGVISSILPLLTNLRRNPINDMRDER